ncbi:BTAD domain-containing putative transcriptional regulator [Kitasatospora xanthocidica]|uniref:BTAD domain-containing putative transcriptional regulator n=1 Tax=Kitasatospora xanthocidica TaxID=83382 RepID=UPI0036E42BAF
MALQDLIPPDDVPRNGQEPAPPARRLPGLPPSGITVAVYEGDPLSRAGVADHLARQHDMTVVPAEGRPPGEAEDIALALVDRLDEPTAARLGKLAAEHERRVVLVLGELDGHRPDLLWEAGIHTVLWRHQATPARLAEAIRTAVRGGGDPSGAFPRRRTPMPLLGAVPGQADGRSAPDGAGGEELSLQAFGTMTARRGERELPLGPPRHRAVLGLLLTRPGQVVPAEELIEELWGGRPPRHPSATLQTYVSHLRRALAPESGSSEATALLRHRPPGYVLTLDPELIDIHRFERLVADGRRDAAARRFQPARDRLTEALSLWRGSPFLELTSYTRLAEEGARLEHVRLEAVEIQAEAWLALGEPDLVVSALARDAHRYPAQERLIGRLMTGLYQSGRQAEALRLYERTRAYLADELGVDPGAELQGIHVDILRQAPAARAVGRPQAPATCPGPAGPAPEAAAVEPRRTRAAERPPVRAATHRQPAALADPHRRPAALAATHRQPPTPAATHRQPPADLPAVGLPFAGRERELTALASLTENALLGGGHLTAVLGEAGIGKTELLARLTTRLEGTGVDVVRGTCWSGEGVPSYWVWSQVLRRLAAARPEEYRAASAQFGDPVESLLPDRHGGGPAVLEDDSGPRSRFLTHDAVCEAVLAVVAERPLLLALEDLHRADRPSLELLRMLGTRTHGRPLGIVVTVRESGISIEPPLGEVAGEVLGSPRTRTVRLDGLSERAVGVLATAQAGAEVGADVVRTLHERSGGNPYLLGQLLSLLSDGSQLLDRKAVQAVLTGVPASVDGVLRRGFSALPEPVLRVLHGCAVLGTEVDLGLLKKVMGGTVTGETVTGEKVMDENVMGEERGLSYAVEPAVRAGLLRQDPHDPRLFSFTHTIVREALLGQMPGEERVRLHARAADVLRSCPESAGREADRIAHHAWQASAVLPADQVVPHLVRAGEQAGLRLAYEESETWLRRALHLLPGLPPDHPAAAGLELSVQNGLAHVLVATRGYGDSEAEAASHRSLVLHTAAGTTDEPVRLWEQCCAQLVTGRYGKCMRSAKQLRKIAEATQDPVAVLSSAFGMGVLLHLRGRHTEALAQLDRAGDASDRFPLDERVPSVPVLQHDPRLPCRSYRALTLWLLGSRAEAGQQGEDLLVLAECDDRPADRAFARYFHALLAALSGDVETAARSSALGLEAATTYGLRYWTAMLQVCQGWARAHSAGPGGGGIELIQSAIADLRAGGTAIRRTLHLGLLAQSQRTAGLVQEEAATLRRLATEVSLRGEYAYLSERLPFNDLGGRSGRGADRRSGTGPATGPATGSPKTGGPKTGEVPPVIPPMTAPPCG